MCNSYIKSRRLWFYKEIKRNTEFDRIAQPKYTMNAKRNRS